LLLNFVFEFSYWFFCMAVTAAFPTGKNSCDMVTGVTIKVAREARLLAGTRAREARPKQRNLCAKRAPSSESERTMQGNKQDGIKIFRMARFARGPSRQVRAGR
jgi:hypothetical protein